MFNLFRRNRNATATAVLEAEQPLIAPTRVRLQPTLVGEVELADYVKLATESGFAPGALMYHRLVHFLRENNIDTYPTGKVEAYLDKLFGTTDARGDRARTWGWCPLRPEDDGKLTNHRIYYQNGGILSGRYNQIVPAPVLETVKSIAQEFKGSDPELHFYVSNKVEPWEGDPFLAVTALGMKFLVIERWDEPSFRQ